MNFFKLRKLGNKLPSTFPAESCYHLEYLEIVNCELEALPGNFAQVCPNLRVLNLNNNPIRDLSSLRHLSRLTRLSVLDNLIDNSENIYSLLTTLPELELLDLRMNPFTISYYPHMDLTNAYRVYIPNKNNDNEDDWTKFDKGFVKSLDDVTYLQRVAYRGLVASSCPTVKILDGILLTLSDYTRANILSQKFREQLTI